MPLSDEEKRILSQIEQQFYESDPEFAHEVRSTTLYSHAFRYVKYGLVLFVAGLVLMVATLRTLPLAFAGVAVMFGSLLLIERNIRKMGRAGWEQVTRQMRTGGVKDYFGSAGQRMKDRFRRDER